MRHRFAKFCSALLLLVALCPAQNRANDLLDRLMSQLTKASITAGNFKQEKQLKVLRKPLLANGVFIYHAQKGVLWETQAPVATQLIVSDTRIVTGEHSEAAPAAFGRVFKALLGGDLTTLEQSFALAGTQQAQGWRLQLTPKDDALRNAIKVILLAGDTELRHLEIHERNGNLTRIDFTDITHPDHLTPEQAADFERLSP